MPQFQPAGQGQRDFKNEAAQSQPRGASSPIMQPFDLMGADAFATSHLGAGVPSFLPLTQDFFGHSLFNSAPQFLDFGHPFLNQFHGPQSFAMPSTEVLHTSGEKRKSQSQSEFKSPKEHNTQPPAQPLWPNYPPGHLPQPDHQYSRLPSSDVARKAPRKSSASSPAQPSSPQLANSTPKSTQRRAAKQHYRARHGSPLPLRCTPTAKESPTRATKPTSSAHRSTPHETLTLPKDLTPLKDPKSPHPSSARSRPVVLDEDDDKDESDDDDLPLSTIFRTKNACTPIRGPATTPNTNTQNQYRAAPRPPRPRTRFEYSVPEELKSIHRALGQDNWTDYVTLIEKKSLKQITEAEFIAKSKSIFMVFNDRTRERIERQIAKTMVLPVIEQHREDDEEHREVVKYG